MRFVVDAQLPPALAAWIRRRGSDANHVFDLNLEDADDAAIARWAINANAAVITKDDDFGRLGYEQLQIVWVRIGNASNTALIAVIEPLWDEICAQLASGVRIIEIR
ncbi:hypothetical protein sos41_42360 [Alphaproteobacteria bacterium SO-S41]|nr:hypothetical protein sos41_42360 [Alphaproteobacteria bacterium SO-S41]